MGHKTSVLNLIRRYILVHSIFFTCLVWIGVEKHHEMFANSDLLVNNTNGDTTWPTSVLLQSMIANYSDDSEKKYLGFTLNAEQIEKTPCHLTNLT